MAKISQEEYEILKELDDKWKWIARDLKETVLSDKLWIYEYIPKRESSFWTEEWGDYKEFPYHLFRFIKWEDREPYSIDNLIEEYEIENGMRYDFGKIKVVDNEVGEEQKFYVMNNSNRMMLVRMVDDKTITEADPLPFDELYDTEKKSYRLTEQEIKDFDTRYLAFKEPVEEVEENDEN